MHCNTNWTWWPTVRRCSNAKWTPRYWQTYSCFHGRRRAVDKHLIVLEEHADAGMAEMSCEKCSMTGRRSWKQDIRREMVKEISYPCQILLRRLCEVTAQLGQLALRTAGARADINMQPFIDWVYHNCEGVCGCDTRMLLLLLLSSVKLA